MALLGLTVGRRRVAAACAVTEDASGTSMRRLWARSSQQAQQVPDGGNGPLAPYALSAQHVGSDMVLVPLKKKRIRHGDNLFCTICIYM